ncbi:MAG: tryptophan--tRNA ligase [Schleiferiaceae bacterium]|nr:tryptophan--tRNA ligase [Schleiferiaceae bacterium]
MARILTGIQSSGVPHLGNALGAIEPALQRAQQAENECFYFIADLHSLTSLKEAPLRRENVRAVAAAWMALGLDVDRHYFYLQSDVPEVTELTWYLSCYTPYPMLANAHSFKDKQDQLEEVNAGLFTYPVLMAADILLYDAEEVPVGKDQKQHLEMTRDIAGAFNHQTGQELLTLPAPRIDDQVMTIPGIDGRKMSKSYGNTIDIFAPAKTLKKQVMRIVTDSRELEEPKDPDRCHVFALYAHLAAGPEIKIMRERYEAGGYGYGHAKKELLRVIHERYGEARERYEALMAEPARIDKALERGADSVRPIAQATLERVRSALGFGSR